MPLTPGCSRKIINKNTAAEIHSGKDPDQAYAIANSVCRALKSKSRSKKSRKH